MIVDKYKKIIKKYIEYILTKLKVLFQQKKFMHGNVEIKYMLKKNINSDKLIVVFSSCTRKGIKARYNYVRTLDKISYNKLFILDDFAADKRGAYYLGHNFDFSEEKATRELIQYIINKLGCEEVYFCGSSKGGYAALDFGLQFENAIIITGAPQYYLADYLSQGNEDALNHIIGNEDRDNRKNILNHYLENRIRNNKNIDNQKIYIHYSNKEHTYFEHIQFLLKELKDYKYSLIENVGEYAEHSEISLYFPDFLCETILEE